MRVKCSIKVHGFIIKCRHNKNSVWWCSSALFQMATWFQLLIGAVDLKIQFEKRNQTEKIEEKKQKTLRENSSK